MNRGPCGNRSRHLWNVHCEWIPGTGSWAQSSDLTCRGALLGNFLKGRVELLWRSRAELALAMGFRTLNKEDKYLSSPGIVNEEKGKISGRAKNIWRTKGMGAESGTKMEGKALPETPECHQMSITEWHLVPQRNSKVCDLAEPCFH